MVGLGGAVPAILFFQAGRAVAAESKAPAGPADPIIDFDAALARGDAGAALQAARAAADWRRRTLAGRPKDLATSLDLLAGRVFQEAGGTSESESVAEMLFREALELRRRAFGAESLEAAGTLDTLSSIHFFQGRFDEAEAEEREVLRLRERLLPDDDPLVAQARDGLGTILYKEGRYAEAEPLLSKALDHYLTEEATDAGRIADTLNVLGELARSRGDFAAAEERYRNGIAVAGGEAPADEAALRAERARLLNSLAGLYKDEGRYNDADDLLRRSLALREKAEPPDAADLATAWLNLAEISRLQGIRDEAERRYARSLELARPALGPDNPELAWFLGQSAVLSSELGRYDEARTLENEAIDLLRRTLGEEHFQTAQALHDLGRLELQRGRPSDALPPLRQALLIRTKVYGVSHPEVALTRIELARALAAAEPAAGETASQEIDAAIATLETGVAYPESLAEAHAVRAGLRRRAGDRPGAIADLEEMARVVEALRPRSGSEAARAGFMSKYAAWYDQMVLDLMHESRIAEAFAAAERGRSRALLDQMALAGVDLRAGIPEPRRGVLTARETAAGAKLAELQERIAVMRGRTDLTEEERRRRVATLDAELTAAARDYADVYGEIRTSSALWRATAGSPPVSLTEAQESVVSAGGAMLLYVIGEEESAVLVVPAGPARSAAAFWQPLAVDEAAGATLGLAQGPLRAADLNRILRGESRRRGVLAALSRPPQRSGFEDEAGGPDADETLNALWRILLPRAVWGRIKGAAEVVVLPDGSLHGLPFEALVVKRKATAARSRYWLDDGPPLRYAASATLLRDVARRPVVTDRRILSVSDPIYDPKAEGRTLHQEDESALRDRFARAGGALVRLPGTARETEAIVAAFGARVTVLQGADADEARVRSALREPGGGVTGGAAAGAPGGGHRYLHLAVHGLVDKEMGYLFAALALTPPAATPAVRPRPENDGFLQLFEIYELDLRSELAVLSACGTQSGREVEGEGVFALSRGFLTAGARRVVASQWSVDDASTAILMGGLFSGIAGAEGGAKAGPPYAAILRDAKRAVRARPEWSAPFYWAPFVLTGAR